jgi:hypothetical protein
MLMQHPQSSTTATIDLIVLIDEFDHDHLPEFQQHQHPEWFQHRIRFYLGWQQQLLQHAVAPRFEILRANYLKRTSPYRPCLPLEKYHTVYFAGVSLDQCVTRTRPWSYSNVKHPRRYLIRECCLQYWQTYQPRRYLTHEQYDDYVATVLKKFASVSITALVS